MQPEERLNIRLLEKEEELKTLRRRVGEQRREIARLREVNDRLVLCRECQYLENGFCHFLAQISIGRMEDDFCSRGKRLPILNEIGTRMR